MNKPVGNPSAAWPAGYRINPRAEGPSEEMLKSFANVPAAWVSDNLGRSIGTIGLRQYHASLATIICGPAYTVRVRPGDNLMIHKALELAEPGDVIVIDGGGDLTQALIGGNMMITARTRRIAGLVIDGALRDVPEWADGGVPVWARGHTHRGPSKDGPGEINVPITCAGMAVLPGDLVIADADGVVAVSPPDLPALLARIKKQAEKEAHLQKVNAEGTADPERFNSILRDKGCPV